MEQGLAGNAPALTEVVGVDGCRAGWIAVRAAPDLTRARAAFHADISGLIAAHPAAMIAIDMPIGLGEGPESRGADAAARALLGPRRSSVFTPPCRAALAAPDYPSANAAQRQATGKGLSKQAWMLAPKLREVDAALTPALQARVFEAHPELAFALVAGAPMAARKTSFHGHFARLGLLARLGFDLPRLAADLPEDLDAQPDDLADASILAHVAARRLRGAALRFPDAPRQDARGLLMEIWG